MKKWTMLLALLLATVFCFPGALAEQEAVESTGDNGGGQLVSHVYEPGDIASGLLAQAFGQEHGTMIVAEVRGEGIPLEAEMPDLVLRLGVAFSQGARLELGLRESQENVGFDIALDIEDAFKVFLEAVKPLGEDYVKDASRALPERWMDVYETKNKRSGAYSCGSAYRTTPYVLLNHKNTYDGLSTLCHEMGHAMHSFYSNKTQPATKARYKIFVAEVASTCNEILLSEYLRKKYADNKQAQIALIGSLLQHFRTTVFRQTMFAEFEYKAHCMAESGESLTRDSLSAMYYDLNKLYYGGACKVDKEVAYEWMRIPHFYNSFYVYKYATSFCAAVALSRGILSGDKEKIAAYRRFLTLGGSMPPIEELKTAGVDMSTPQPVCDALDYFAELIMQYQNLLNDEG